MLKHDLSKRTPIWECPQYTVLIVLKQFFLYIDFSTYIEDIITFTCRDRLKIQHYKVLNKQH